MSNTRAISYSEGVALLDCQAKHAFGYTGALTGGMVIKPKDTPVLLREGRAWGRAVAAFHAEHNDADRLVAGKLALEKALAEDAAEQEKAGFYDEDIHTLTVRTLRGNLEHYAELDTEPLTIDRLEHELLVPLPSRSGKGDSNRYRLQVFFDGIEYDVDRDGDWLVEFKRRGQLTPLELIANSRQIRYYAWAYQRETGRKVLGIIVDERLKEIPKPARWVRPKKKADGIAVDPDQAAKLGAPYSDAELEIYKGDEGKLARRTVSHAKEQLTTSAMYAKACATAGVEVDPEVTEALDARRWQQRERIFLSDVEIEEAGQELVSLGRQVAALDRGEVYPVRNPSKMRCPGCFFKEICNRPDDTELVDALFDRRPPKRDREDIAR